jgi:hypothetical protein
MIGELLFLRDDQGHRQETERHLKVNSSVHEKNMS